MEAKIKDSINEIMKKEDVICILTYSLIGSVAGYFLDKIFISLLTGALFGTSLSILARFVYWK